MKCATIVLTCLLAFYAAAQEPETPGQNTTEPESDLTSILEQALGKLESLGYATDSDVAQQRALESMLLSADPGGRLLEDPAASPRSSVQEDIAETAVLPRRIGYVKLNGVEAPTGHKLLDWLEGLDHPPIGFVLDLRGAAGADDSGCRPLLERYAAVEAPYYRFLPRTGDGDSWSAGSFQKSDLSVPLVLLVDGDTRQAAEVLVAAARGACPRVVIIGSTTRGDMLVRDVVPLVPGFSYYIGTRILEVAGGTTYDGTRGVIPHVQIDPDAAVAPLSELPPLREDADALEVENRALRERVGEDLPLRHAADLLLGLHALQAD